MCKLSVEKTIITVITTVIVHLHISRDENAFCEKKLKILAMDNFKWWKWKKHNSKLPEQPGEKIKSAEKLKILIPV